MLKLFVYLGLALSLAACQHKQTHFDQGGSASNSEGEKNVTANLVWVKNKKSEIHVQLKISNHMDSPVRIYSGDMVLEYGGAKVAPHENGDIRLASGVRSEATLRFPIGKGKERSGDATLKIVPYGEGDKPLAPINLKFYIEGA